MWAVRGVTRTYFGRSTDQPLPADYTGDGITNVALFRSYYGLWSIKGVSRIYLGKTGDEAVPADFNGNLSADPAIFRADNGLWAISGMARYYFGQTGDQAVSGYGRGDYNGDGTADIAIFRSSNGLWAIRNITRVYWGSGYEPVPGDYDGDGTTDVAYFQDSIGKWAVRDVTQIWWGTAGDDALPGDFNGDGVTDASVFRSSNHLWVIQGVTRAYFGGSDDQPVPGDYDGNGTRDIAIFRALTTPTPAPTPTPGEDTIYSIQHDGKTGTVTVTGIVSVVFPSMEFYIADASGAYNGIDVFQNTYGPKIGDSVTITGQVADYYGKTEIQSLTAFAINSRGNTPYTPVTITASQLTDEQYEGCLVKIDTVTVTNAGLGSGKWQVSDGSTATIDDELDYNYFAFNGDNFNSVAGIVMRNTSQSPQQWLQPRDTADLDADKDVLPHYALYGDVVTMDDSHNVYDSYYIEVKGDLIQGITAAPPVGVDVIDVDGLIFPGMISTHDHLSYDLFDFIPFTEAPNFVDRNAWAATQMYCDFKSQRGGFSSYYDEICKLAEVRMASSGCTVTQSQVASFSRSDDPFAKLGVGILNGERFPGRCKDVVVGTTDNDMVSEWTAAHEDGVNGVLHRYIVHLGETTDKPGNDMAYQWNWWMAHDGFDGRDTIIHGINIPAAEYALFNHGTDAFGDPLKTVLSWACKSNMLLYDTTADVSGALGQGATVALAPDWSESGMPNMLAELNYCKYTADNKAWNIQTREFIDMVTRNAAAGFGRLNDLGSIEAGKIANFMVIDDGPGDPYDDLMMVAGAGATYDYRCGPQDVKLTVVAGRPIYGDDALLNTTNFPFVYGPYIEDLTICSTAKKLNIARYNPGSSYSGVDDLFLDYYIEMWTKYSYSSQYPAPFLSYDPAGAVPPTPVPTATPPAGTYVISSGSDDACQHISYYTDSASYVYFGRHTVSEGYYAGYRFNDIAIPQGATITTAYLVLTQYTSYASAQPILKVAAQDIDDSPTFSSGNGPMDRSGQLTTAQIDWTPAAGTSDVQFQSPDITSVVQEVINRAGWVSGNSLSIILAPNEAAVDHRRRSWAYDGSPPKAAQLILDYISYTPTPTPEGFESPTPTPSVAPTSTPSPTPEGFKTPTPTVTPDTSNLLTNSSFESWTTSTQPEDWTDGSYGDATYQQEAGTVHGGTYSLKLTTTADPGSYGDGIYQDQVVSVGQQYTFSAWLWSEETGAMGITASWYDGASPHYWDTVQTTDAGQWTQWSIQSVAPAGTVSVRCFIRGFANTTNCGYGDDAVLSSP